MAPDAPLVQQPDQRAHQRAIDEREAPQRQPGMVAGAVEPAVDEAQRKVAPAMREQVHRGEGGVVDDVDPAQAGVELDRVERHHVVVEQHEVGEVQVAVALAHAAGGEPRAQQRRQRCGLALEPPRSAPQSAVRCGASAATASSAASAASRAARRCRSRCRLRRAARPRAARRGAARAGRCRARAACRPRHARRAASRARSGACARHSRAPRRHRRAPAHPACR